jgi:hypothetical protein
MSYVAPPPPPVGTVKIAVFCMIGSPIWINVSMSIITRQMENVKENLSILGKILKIS